MNEEETNHIEQAVLQGEQAAWRQVYRQALEGLGFTDTGRALLELADTRAEIYALARALEVEVDTGLHLADMVRRIEKVVVR